MVACVLFIGICYYGGMKLLCGLSLRSCTNGEVCPDDSQCMVYGKSKRCVSSLCQKVQRQEKAIAQTVKKLQLQVTQWVNRTIDRYN